MAHDVRSPHIFVDGPGNTASGDQVMDNFDAAWLGIDAAQAVPGGFNAAGVVRRGKSIIAGAESRTNVAYGVLTTPDRVSSVVLPADGLIAVVYQATWQESVAGAGRAALFIGANQLKIALANTAAPVTQAGATGSGVAPFDRSLITYPGGLGSMGGSTNEVDVTTGQVAGAYIGSAQILAAEVGGTVGTVAAPGAVGGPVFVFAAAGTYDVSVQFKSTSGSVTVKDRKLWVWTMGF